MASTSNGIENAKASPHHGRRLRKLLRPNGRRVHIAASPEEHERLRRDLAKVEPDEDFDVYIHGSDEHVKHCMIIFPSKR